MFSEKRVAQMAAYLLNKSGGHMAYIKLLKLLYLAERQAMAKWGESISGDRFVSMPYGPVLSQTYALIQGHAGLQSFWNDLIQDESNYEVSLKNPINDDTFDELSTAELELLNDTFQQYGYMTKFQIVNYTHDNCPEWQDPNGSSYPIKPEAIFRAMGKTEDQIQEMLKNYHEQQELDRIRASLA